MRRIILLAALLPAALVAQEISNVDITLASRLVGSGVNDLAGSAVYLEGDYNGDGIADVAIGAPNVDSSDGLRATVGKVYVIYGRPGTLPDLLTLESITGDEGFIVEGHFTNLFLGETLTAVDLNGDGIDDLVAAAPRAPDFTASFAPPNLGLLVVIFGSRDPIPSVVISSLVVTGLQNSGVGFVLEGGFLNGRAGKTLSPGGDINGDGLQDLLIGSENGGSGFGGNVRPTGYVLFGRDSSDAWPGNYKLVSLRPSITDGSDGTIVQGDGIEDLTGRDMVGLGDVNGDGFDDFMVGAPGATLDQPEQGAVYVIAGKPSYPDSIDLNSSSPDGLLTRIGGRPEQRIGGSLAAPGDLNGDGRADLVIGSPAATELNGSIDVIYSPSSWPREIRLAGGFDGFTLNGSAGERLSSSLAPAGDLNGDGLADLMVGSRDHPSGGRTWIVYGDRGRSGERAIDGAPRVGFVGAENAQDSLGRAVSGFGDLDADGSRDLLTGAPLSDAIVQNGGVSYYFRGTGQDGAPPMRGPLSHAWFDPTASGQGVLLEYGLRNGQPGLFGAWYTYDDGEPLWLVTDLITLPSVGRTVETSLFVTDGGRFGPSFDAAAITSRPFGTVRITQTRCGRLLWEYERSSDGLAGRLVLVPVLADQLGLDTCTIDGVDARSDSLRAQQVGTWWNPARAGEGIIFDVEGRSDPARFFFSWFTYAAGRQLWLVGSAAINATTGQPETFDVLSASGADFGDAFEPSDVALSNLGTATLSFAGCDAASLDYSLTIEGETVAGSIDLERFTGGLSEFSCSLTR